MTPEVQASLAALGLASAKFTELHSGAWSQAFAVSTPDGSRVLRISDFRDDFDKDVIAAGWSRPGLPIPAVEAVGTVGGRFYALTQWVAGAPIESERTFPLDSLALALIAKAGVDPAGPGWGGMDAAGVGSQQSWRAHLLWAATDHPTSRIAGWGERLAAFPSRAGVHARHVAALEAVATDDVPRGVIHGDLLNRNVHAVDGTITGVFDWGCAAYGDPLYDVAWFIFMAPHYPQIDVSALSVVVEPGMAHPQVRRRMLACLLHIGVDHLAFNAHLEKWEVFDAVGARTEQLLAEYEQRML